MLQPLSRFLHDKRDAQAWDESDARHFIQQWLRAETHTQQIYCERFLRGVATVRAVSPAVRQVAKLSEVDLQQALKQAGGLKLTRVVVTQ